MTTAGLEDSSSLTLIQSLQRGLRLVEVVVEKGPMTARGMSDAIGIGLPATWNLLRTLVHEGFLVRQSGGLYALGPQLHSAAARERDAAAVRALREVLGELRDTTAATAIVAEFDGREVRISHVAPSRKGPRPDVWTGRSLPWHATALGKAVLDGLTLAERHDVLSRAPLEAFTFRTSVAPERLSRELEKPAVRFADEEYLYGISCLAVPLGTARPAAIGIAFSASIGAKRRAQLERALIAAADGVVLAASGPEVA
jgi:DNA-binding IclR family transcriptional regulator